MSLNTTTLKQNYTKILGHELPFDLVVGETLCYASKTGRQTLLLVLTSGPKISINCKDGFVYLTTSRLVFVTASSGDVDLFSVDLPLARQLHFSHAVKSPWFGANYWQFSFLSGPGGLPQGNTFKGDITFSDGGLFDFVGHFDRVLNDILNNSHIDEELPRYEE